MQSRGRFMVNMISKVNNDEPPEDLGREDIHRMYKLNQHPDRTFISHQSSPNQKLDENEYSYNNNKDHNIDLESFSLVQINTEKSGNSADTRTIEASETSSAKHVSRVLTGMSDSNELFNGLQIIQSNYVTYSDSSRGSLCDSDQDLITPRDLGVTSPEPIDFMWPAEIDNEADTLVLRGPLDYHKDDSSEDENTFDDYSATDGSDFVPSSTDSDATCFSEDERDLIPIIPELCNRREQELEDSTVEITNEARKLPSILVDPVTKPDESMEDIIPNTSELCNREEQELKDSNVEITSEARESPSLLVEKVNEPDESMEDQEQSSYLGRPLRGRKRKCPQNRSERKLARNSNKEYYDHKLRYKPPRDFEDFTCKCKKKCKTTVSLETRINFHKKFWSLGSYNSQTTFLGVFVKEVRSEKPTKRKQFLRHYKIETHDVCRDMFCKTLSICSTRISTAMDKIHSRKPLLDQRGSKKGGENRVPDVRIQEIKDFIDSLPLYTSHYSRSKTSAKFFKPGVTLSAVYDEYKAKLTPNAVSYSLFKKIFYSNFNIKVKILSKDTCNICDKFRIELLNAEKSCGDVNSIKEAHNNHLHQAERARNQLKMDMNLAKNQEDVECLTFDMQKTLPLPRIQTNIIFYKRQIWLYNLGVHSAKNHQSYCYTWVEGQAGRGAQEVGSSLLKHIDKNVSDTIKYLILWSDSCGGQNRNIKITLMMKAVLEMKPNLESIIFKYLMPGHSYLPNDKDFGDIERAMKYNQRIYTPDDYIQIMALCKKKKPLITCQMQVDDFYSTETIEKSIVNRKKTISNNKVNWLKTRELKITKTDRYHIYMKSDFDQEDYDCLDITRKTSRRQNDYNNREESAFKSQLCKLWTNGKPIAEPKLRDIISIRHLIPEDARHFYDNLTSRAEIEDDIDGFNTELDFNLEEEE